MTTPLWCLLIVAFMPFPLAVFGGYLRISQLGRLDNQHPRQQIGELKGLGARVYAAQANAWEALALFTVAVVTAHLAGANAADSANAAMLFVAARVLHAVFYLANLATLRSLIMFVGVGSCIWLFVLAASAA